MSVPEERCVYVYNLDPKTVEACEVQDWMGHVGPVMDVAVQLDNAVRQSCFRVVFATADAANVALNYLDGVEFKNSVARVESRVFLKTLKKPVSAAASAAASAAEIAAPPRANCLLPDNHAVPEPIALIGPLMEHALARLGIGADDTATEGQGAPPNAGPSTTAAAPVGEALGAERAAKWRADFERLQTLQRQLVALTQQKEALELRRNPRLAAAVARRQQAEADPTVAALQADRLARMVVVHQPRDAPPLDVDRIVLGVARVIGPVTAAGLVPAAAVGAKGLVHASTLAIELAFAQDADALCALRSTKTSRPTQLATRLGTSLRFPAAGVVYGAAGPATRNVSGGSSGGGSLMEAVHRNAGDSKESADIFADTAAELKRYAFERPAAVPSFVTSEASGVAMFSDSIPMRASSACRPHFTAEELRAMLCF